MSKPKIKHKKPKQPRRPSAVGQLINSLTRHRELVPRTLAYITPTLTPEEHSQAAYLAEAIFAELEKKSGARMKMIVPIFMYERVIGGIVQYLEFQRSDNADPNKDFVPPGGPAGDAGMHAQGKGERTSAATEDTRPGDGSGLGVHHRPGDEGSPDADPQPDVAESGS